MMYNERYGVFTQTEAATIMIHIALTNVDDCCIVAKFLENMYVVKHRFTREQ